MSGELFWAGQNPRRREQVRLTEARATGALAKTTRGAYNKPVVAIAAQAVALGQPSAEPQIAREFHAEFGVEHRLGRAARRTGKVQKRESQ